MTQVIHIMNCLSQLDFKNEINDKLEKLHYNTKEAQVKDIKFIHTIDSFGQIRYSAYIIYSI